MIHIVSKMNFKYYAVDGRKINANVCIIDKPNSKSRSVPTFVPNQPKSELVLSVKS